MTLLALGLNHKTAPLALRETVAFSDSELPSALASLRERGLEASILSTCNRTEIYAVAPDAGPLLDWWCQARKLRRDELVPHLYQHAARDCVRHAMRVAAGLDSMVLGEPQILGQMKQSYQQAQDAGSAGAQLSRLFEHAFSLAKLVRTETDIGTHPVSVAFAGVALARRIFADFSRLTALLIGAGEMIRLSAQHLAQAGVGRMIFANRTLVRAQALAAQHHGYAVALPDLPGHLSEADLVISCTAHPGYLVTQEMARAAVERRRHRPVFMLDLAVPRDIDPKIAELEDVYLYTVDDLRDAISDNLRSRELAAQSAETMIEARADSFMRWLDGRESVEAISRLRVRSEQQADEVLERAQRLLAQGKTPAEALQFLRQGLLNKFLHAPSAALRNAATDDRRALHEALEKLLDVEPEDG